MSLIRPFSMAPFWFIFWFNWCCQWQVWVQLLIWYPMALLLFDSGFQYAVNFQHFGSFFELCL